MWPDAVARRYRLHTSQLFTWRQQQHRRATSPAASGEPAFVPVLLAEDGPVPAEAVVVGATLSATIHAFCSAVQRRRRPPPVRPSMRRQPSPFAAVVRL